MIETRDYVDPDDKPELRSCIVQLQNYERAIDPRLPEGEAMADDYLQFLFNRCAECDGSVVFAVQDGGIVGFVCVLAKVASTDPDDPPTEYAYIAALMVREPYRGQGIGEMLLSKAETFARSKGSSEMRIGVLAGNGIARSLYRKTGFTEFYVELKKRFEAGTD